ncbi:probable protein RRP5 homolog [Coccomyxa sp. Obi]|nr:probable protein RRP5 homolog [Coccomyxa sp. Obi]
MRTMVAVKRPAPSEAAPAKKSQEQKPLEEEDFPRGGGGGLSALQRRELREEGAAEAAREFAAEGGARKRRKREDGEDLFFAREALQGKLPKYVELLRFKSLSKGAKIWGTVAEVTHRELVISLPHGLKGHVPPNEASDVLAELLAKQERAGAAEGIKARKAADVPSLASLFRVGQLVQCSIVDLQDATPSTGGKAGKKRIVLSLHVAKVNAGIGAAALVPGMHLPACVRSMEDHGFLLTTGVQGVTAFLERTNWLKACGGEARPLLPGTVLPVAVTAAARPGRPLVHISADPKTLAKGVVKEWEGLTIGSLLPGMLVNARVRSVLSDGLLVSFLTYFNGTIDCFHLGQELPSSDWQKGYEAGARVRARIIYVDPVSKRVCLSLLPHLVAGASSPPLPAINTLFEHSIVRRVDNALGLLLELRSAEDNAPTEQDHGAGSPDDTSKGKKKKKKQKQTGGDGAKDGKAQPRAVAGYAHISAVSDTHIEKLDKVYKVGKKVAARVIGARPMDGLAVCSLKEAAVRAGTISYSDITPGSIVSGTVDNIEDFGLFVKLAPGVKALVPTMHMSDSGSERARAKFKEGQKVTGRVLEVDPAARRITLSLKKLLVGEKLPPFASWQEAAQPGARAHGFVTGMQEYGVFVSFCNGVRGLAPTQQLGLEPNQDPAKHFPIGKTVKARVVSVDEERQRLRLSFAPKTAADAAVAAGADPLAGLQPGVIVEGRVRSITTKEVDGEAVPAHYLVELRTGGANLGALGRLDVAHLADHPAAEAALAEAIVAGSELGQLLVLERLEKAGVLRVTRKTSLLAAATQLPATIEDVKEGTLAPGYVANVTADAVFVRFLGGLTGRAGLAQLADQFVSDPARHFTEGQSVRAAVVTVDAAKQRFTLALKQSLAGAPDAAYACSLFADLEAAERIRSVAEPGSGQVEWSELPIGGRAAGRVHDVKDYGVVCDLDAHADVVALATPDQVEGEATPGARIKGRILDVNKKDGIVDLTLKAALVAAAPKKAAKATQPEVGAKVEGVVELVKDDYLVLSLPAQQHAIAFAATGDFNLGPAQEGRQFSPGQKLSAVVAAEASPENGGRTIVHMALGGDSSGSEAAGRGSKRERKPAKISPGTIISAKVTNVHATHAGVELESGARGRVHITEVEDEAAPLSEVSPLERLKPGDSVKAAVLGMVPTKYGRNHGLLELSLRPSLLAAEKGARKPGMLSVEDLQAGQSVRGYVQEIAVDCAWLVLSPALRGRLHALDSADDVTQLGGFATRFAVGQPLRCRVVQVDKGRGQVDLTLRKDGAPYDPVEAGALVNGQITQVSGTGVRVHLAGHASGHVPVTDIHDSFVPNAIEGIEVGDFVRCRVIGQAEAKGVNNSGREKREGQEGVWQLSLRPSQGAWREGVPAASTSDDAAPEKLNLGDLKIGQQVRGYVKSVSAAGAFVALARDLEARVKLNNLADGYVEEPKTAFPEGQLVTGRIIATDHNRIELSLKTKGWATLEDFREGQVVRGRVRRSERFGVFVRIDDSAVTGMCHVSEVADERVEDLPAMFKPGQGVRAKVLSVDAEKQRLSLGLKPSYFDDDEEDPEEAEEEEGTPGNVDDDMDAEVLEAMEESSDEEEDWRAGAEILTGEEDDGSGGGEDDGEGESSEAAEESEDADMDAAEISDDVEEEPPAAAEESTKGRKRSAAAAGISGRDADELDLGEGVGWMEEDTNEGAANAAGDGDDVAADRALTKRQRRRLKAEEEERIRAAEARQLQQPLPESEVDFERLVLESPNSSYVWIRYMAFHMGVGEIDKARGVAERALKTINFREEREKLNVWVAWLNLENLHGSPPDEAVMKLFQRALPHTDSKKLYLALLTILERTSKEELAQQTLRAMTRKYATSAKVWLRAYSHELGRGDAAAARRALDRAIAALPARKHIKVLSQAALTEFKTGDPERGRGVFEGILRNYPKRLDLWSIYLDQEIRAGDKQRARSLFERATHLSLPPRKMKFLFKRYLDFEKAHGDAASVEHVIQAAKEYVEASLAEQ